MIILYENFPQEFFSVVVITEKCIKNISFEADQRFQSTKDAINIFDQGTEATDNQSRQGRILSENQRNLLGSEVDKVLDKIHSALHHVDVVLKDICTSLVHNDLGIDLKAMF